MNTCRLAVTAAFARGMPNYATEPPRPPTDKPGGDDVACPTARQPRPVGNAGRAGNLRRRDGRTGRKIAGMLACHASQMQWLDQSQGMNSYLQEMHDLGREVGRMSGNFAVAEGWRKHLYRGFCDSEADPLIAAIGEYCWRENDEIRNSKFESS